jgi:hypothetical protein
MGVSGNMMDFYKELSHCTRCGGDPTVDMYTFYADGGEAMEIRCRNCGLTMRYDTENAHLVRGGNITLAQNVSWSYRDRGHKNAIEIWNAGFGGVKNA